MNVEAKVAAILQAKPAGRVNFKIDTVSIDSLQMDKVAKAIVDGSIEIKVGGSGPNFGASYSSWKTRRQNPGEKKKIGQITISKESTETQQGKVAIFHESVHALMDVGNYKLAMRKDEAFAYLADALYMAIWNVKTPSIGNVGALYTAANAIIGSHKMLTKPGSVLKWADCDDLIAAIKAIPAYS